MKIVITTVQIPFVQGGAEFLASNLKKALLDAGHEAEILTMPFMDNPPELLENHIVASRLLNVENSWGGHHDLCIALKFPAYYMPHPNKVVWALHQHRAAFDLFDTEYSSIKNNEEGRKIRDMIRNADQKYLREAKSIYTIAQNVSNRMMKYTNISSTPLYHPCPDMDKFYHSEYGDYILMPSRINITKRQMLALEALTLTKKDVKLCIVGKAENDIEKNKILNFIRENHLEKRVTYMDFVSQEKKLDLYAKAKAVLFIPKDEDYGYITLEAMSASKMVITMKDSGGPLEFIDDEKNGVISIHSAQELARHLDEVWSSKSMAENYGQAAKKKLVDMDITWSNVVKELTK